MQQIIITLYLYRFTVPFVLPVAFSSYNFTNKTFFFFFYKINKNKIKTVESILHNSFF